MGESTLFAGVVCRCTNKRVKAAGRINVAGLQELSFTSWPPLCGLGKAD